MSVEEGAAPRPVIVVSERQLNSVIDEAVNNVLNQLKPEDLQRLRQEHADNPHQPLDLSFLDWDCSLSYHQACELGDASRVSVGPRPPI